MNRRNRGLGRVLGVCVNDNVAGPHLGGLQARGDRFRYRLSHRTRVTQGIACICTSHKIKTIQDEQSVVDSPDPRPRRQSRPRRPCACWKLQARKAALRHNLILWR